MARKRLNKRIVAGGIIVLLLMSIPLLLTRNVIRGQFAKPLDHLDTARKARNNENYAAAEKYFMKAYRDARLKKDDKTLIQVLFEFAEFNTLNNTIRNNEEIPKKDPSYTEANWEKARGCWNEIVTIDPKNIQAHRKILDYYYEVSDSGSSRNLWKMVETNAEELLKVYGEKGLDPELFIQLTLGRARLEIASIGEVPDREKLLAEAVPILRKVIELRSSEEKQKEYAGMRAELSKAIQLLSEVKTEGGLSGDCVKQIAAIVTILKEQCAAIRREFGPDPNRNGDLERFEKGLTKIESGISSTPPKVDNELFVQLHTMGPKYLAMMDEGIAALHQYLAQAELLKGQLESLKGNSVAEKMAAQQAMELLKLAMDTNPDNLFIHINWMQSREQVLSLAWKEIAQSLQSLFGQLGSEWEKSRKIASLFTDNKTDPDQTKRQTSVRKTVSAFYAYLDSLSRLRNPTPSSIQRLMDSEKLLRESLQDETFQKIAQADRSKEPFVDLAKWMNNKFKTIEEPPLKNDDKVDPEKDFIALVHWLVSQSANWTDQKELTKLARWHRESVMLLTADYEGLPSKFGEQPSVYFALAEFRLSQSDAAGAIAHIEKAHALDATKFEHAQLAAILYYRQFSLAPDFKDNDQVQKFLKDHYKQCFDGKQVIEVMPKPDKLDESNFKEALQAAVLYYRQFGLTSEFKGSISWLEQAISIVAGALIYPDTQDIPGPRQNIQNYRRQELYDRLAAWQIEKYRLDKVIEIAKSVELNKLESAKTKSEDSVEKLRKELKDAQEIAAATEKAAQDSINQIQQFLKTSDNVYMGKWRGMLALAKGQVDLEAAAAETDPKDKDNKTRKASKQISDAVTTLYAAYQQLAGLKQSDPQLCYALAEAFRGRPEYGARWEFLNQSFTADKSILSMKPNVLLDYAELGMTLKQFSNPIPIVDLYEASYPATPRSREIRFKGLLLTGQFDEAEKWIQSLDPASDRLPAYNALLIHQRIGSLYSDLGETKDSLRSLGLQRELLDEASKSDEPQDPDTLAQAKKDLDEKQKKYTKDQNDLQAQIDALVPKRQQIVETMMQKDPKTVEPAILMEVCRNLANPRMTDKAPQTEIDKAKQEGTMKARQLVASFIQAFPRYIPMLTFPNTLDWPDLDKLPEEKRKEEEDRRKIQMDKFTIAATQEVFKDQPVDQAVELARYYLARPAPLFKPADNRKAARDALQPVKDIGAEDDRVVETRLELALTPESDQPGAKPDLAAARTWAQKAKERDIDQCGGLYFQARIDLVDGQYAAAAEKLTECIRLRPIFPRAYFFRAMAQQALKNLTEAAKDADRAYEWTLVDGEIARLRANIYYQLYRKAGSNPTPEEYTRMSQTLFSAVMLNPENWELLNNYAELIKDREPVRALGIRQNLMAQKPSAETGGLLGGLALRLYDTIDGNPSIQRGLDPKGESTKAYLKNYLLQIARNALKKAMNIADNDLKMAKGAEQTAKAELAKQALMSVWSEYLRVSGQQGLAEKTLPKDSLSMVDFYLNDGQFDKARAVLEQLYAKDQKDPKSTSFAAILRGLAFVAARTGDAAGLERYTGELTKLDLDPKAKENLDLWTLQLLMETPQDPDTIRSRAASIRERYPDNIEGLVLQAKADIYARDEVNALARVEDILKQKPDHAGAWRLRGILNLRSSKPDSAKQAISDLQKSISIVDDPATRIELARTYKMMGQTTSAIGELVAAMEKPQCPMLARKYLEEIYQQSGRKDELQKLYDQAVEKYPDDPGWLSRAGVYFLTQYQNQYDQEQAQALKQGKLKPGEPLMPSAVSDKARPLLEKAKPLLEKAWKLSEDKRKQNPQFYANLLDYYLESLLQELENKTQLTINTREASKYIATPLAPIAYSQMAQMNLKLGDRTQALQLFDKALESAKPQPEFVVQLLVVMQKVLGSDKEVRSWCDKTLAADPKHIGATYMMFLLAQSAGQFNTAIEYIDRCLAQLPDKNNTWVEYTIQKSQALLQAFLKTSDKQYLSGGVDLYESILKANPNHPKIPMILNNLAYLLADNDQQLDKAVGYARQSLKETPFDPARLDTLAYALAKSKQFEEAEKTAKMSIQYHELAGNPVPWDGYYHLGMAQEGLAKAAEAKASYQKALQTGGDTLSAADKELVNKAIQRVSK